MQVRWQEMVSIGSAIIRTLLRTYCEVGFEIFRRSGDIDVYDDAMLNLKAAEDRLGDPDITRIIASYERQMSGQICSGRNLAAAGGM